MNETIYAKYTDYRNNRYRLLTRIVENTDTGERTVVKESADGSDAAAHLAATAHAHELLVNLYGGTLNICPVEWDGTRLTFPFISGTSFQSVLDDAVVDGSPDVLAETFAAYAGLLEGGAENSTEFTATEQFEAVFGQHPELAGSRALRISNLDASGNNLILDESGQLTLIDYEWVMNFPIPRDFVIYRNLRVMHEAHWEHRIRFDTLLALCNVSMDRTVLGALDRAFTEHITLGRNHEPSRERILQEHRLGGIEHDRLYRRTEHLVYLDAGNGLQADNMVSFPARSSTMCFTIDVRGLAALRIDPFGGARCLLRSVRCVTEDGSELPVEPAFATKTDDALVCSSPANLNIRIPQGTSTVTFSADASLLETEEDFVSVQDRGHARAALAESHARISALENAVQARDAESESLRAQLAETRDALRAAQDSAAQAHAELSSIVASRSWRYTQWLRNLRGRLGHRDR